MNRLAAAATLALLLAAAGCGGDDEPADAPGETVTVTEAAESTPTSSVMPNATYSSPEALRDAVVELGFECEDWQMQEAGLKYEASSGTCDDGYQTYFSIFTTELDLQRQLDFMAGVVDQFSSPLLVGPNWILNVPDADNYAADLGGTLLGG